MDTSYSRLGQLAKVNAGFKGGPFFQNLITPAKMTISDPRPASMNAQFSAKPVTGSLPGATYSERKNKN